MEPMNMMSRHVALGVVGAMLAASGIAIAQNFDKPLESSRTTVRSGDGARAQSGSQVSITSIEDDDRYEVRIRNGEVSARINGREVPAERIRQTEEGVDILDEQGEVIKSFNISAGITPPAPPAPPGARGGGWVTPRDLQQFPNTDVPAPAAPAPRVMIGITMVPVPEALVEHLDIEPGQAVMIDRVIEGLPAEKAGLRPRDLIVEVEGQRPVTDEVIRQHIRKLEPGDKLSLKVLRRGKEEAVRITVDKFNPEKFQVALAPEAGVAMPLDQEQMAEAEKRIAEAERLMAERLRAFEGRLGPDIHERFKGRGLGGVGPDGFELFIPGNPGQERQYRDRFNELDERMADLERQMEGLADRLEELMAALERREERRRDEP